MLKIPFTSDPSVVFTAQLDNGIKYTFTTRYNDVGGFWTFDLVREIDQVRLVSGIPILLGQDLLSPYGLGIGGMVAVDESNTDVDAGPEDLGTRVVVWSLTAEELAEATASATT